jgi:hypothetical protein
MVGIETEVMVGIETEVMGIGTEVMGIVDLGTEVMGIVDLVTEMTKSLVIEEIFVKKMKTIVQKKNHQEKQKMKQGLLDLLFVNRSNVQFFALLKCSFSAHNLSMFLLVLYGE